MVLKSNRKELYFDDGEEMPDKTRQQYLERKLRQAINRAWKKSLWARDMMAKAKVKPADIVSSKRLVRLPITHRQDLLELQKTHPPYGGLLIVNPAEIERVTASGDVIYVPVRSGQTKTFDRPLWAAGFRKGDVVFNAFDYSSPLGLPVHEGLRDCGAVVVPTGDSNAEKALQMMLDLKPVGYTGPVIFLLDLIKKAETAGLNFRDNFNVKHAFFTGQPVAVDIRKMLEENCGLDTSVAYSVTDLGGCVACECPRKSGLHIMDDFLLEIVDPVTGNPLKTGETGEIVLTPLNDKARGIIRFGTGEMAAITTEPCACGRTSHRLIK
jgi:phenylacetate-CoA ligase